MSYNVKMKYKPVENRLGYLLPLLSAIKHPSPKSYDLNKIVIF